MGWARGAIDRHRALSGSDRRYDRPIRVEVMLLLLVAAVDRNALTRTRRWISGWGVRWCVGNKVDTTDETDGCQLLVLAMRCNRKSGKIAMLAESLC